MKKSMTLYNIVAILLLTQINVCYPTMEDVRTVEIALQQYLMSTAETVWQASSLMTVTDLVYVRYIITCNSKNRILYIHINSSNWT